MVLLELLTTKPPALQDPRTKAITEMYKGINKEKLWNMVIGTGEIMVWESFSRYNGVAVGIQA